MRKKSKPAAKTIDASPNERQLLQVGDSSIAPPVIYLDWQKKAASGNPRQLKQFRQGQFDAVYCLHTLTAVPPAERSAWLALILHTLKPHGFVQIQIRDFDRILKDAGSRQLGLDSTFASKSDRSLTLNEMIYGSTNLPVTSGISLSGLVDLLVKSGFPHVYGGTSVGDYDISVYAFPEIPISEFAQLLGLPQERTPEVVTPTKYSLGNLSIIEVRALATEYCERNDLAGAIALYRRWISESFSPLSFAAFFNIGCLLGELADLNGAAEAYRNALRLKPDFLPARANLGATYERLGDIHSAITEWEAIVDLHRDNAGDHSAILAACNNLGRIYELRKQYANAESRLTLSLSLKPDQPDVIHHLVHLRQRQCIWPIYQELPGVSKDKLIEHTSALSMLSATDNPELQLKTAKRYISEAVTESYPPMAPTQPYGHQRLRIGYLSSNFGRHAVSILTSELFELHNRSRFEIFGFSMSKSDGSAMRQRVESAMDHFVSIQALTDKAAAREIRNAEIDILIDLQGLTLGVRPAILAYRPAPIQITYLGFPGTTGSPWIDYVLADQYLIPTELERFYTEKPLRMPHCFQVNDRKREIGPSLTRADQGLPKDAFVFCAFNNNYKITSELFDRWMNILKRTPDSVLWLLADNSWAQDNLTKEAEIRGVSRTRLIFASRVQPAQYLARYQLADLFLDTYPFNGGTTVSDALWAGLPVITCSGQTFASRMGGSLLRNINLNDLICQTFDEYEDRSVFYANNKPTLSNLTMALKGNIFSTPLFDTPNFTHHLEAILLEIYRTHKTSRQ